MGRWLKNYMNKYPETKGIQTDKTDKTSGERQAGIFDFCTEAERIKAV